MSGNFFSKAYRIYNTNTAYAIANTMWSISDFFSSHSGYQRVAWYSGSANGGGANRTYESSPLGERAFFVYRAVSGSGVTTSSTGPLGVPPFDVAFSSAFGELTTTNPREWQSTNGYGVTMAMAWHANEKPWSGTATNVGNDTFTAGATAPFSASSVVLPRINGTSGTDATKRNGMITLAAGTAETILVCSADNDTIFLGLAANVGSNATFDQIIIAGGYERITGSYNVPLCMLQNPTLATDMGSITTRDGGGAITTSTSAGRICRIEHPELSNYALAESTTYNEEAVQYVTEYPITVWQYEASNYRPAGYLNSFRVVSRNIPNFLVYPSGSTNRLVLKTGAIASFTIPWASSAFGTIKV